MSNAAPRTALITGASAGIGEAYAKGLAESGFNLILTARRKDKLDQLAQQLEDTFGIQTLVLPADLASDTAPAELMKQIENAGWAVDYLVNNAGYGVGGQYTSNPWSTHSDFMQVMVNAVLELTYLALPSMQARGYGRVANVASLAGLMPSTAGHTLYGACKSFLIKFSESLNDENREHGVHVCAVCPGFTYSEFHDVAGTREQVSQMAGYMWQTADEVVAEGMRATEQGKSYYVTGGVNRFLAWLGRHLPRGLLYRLMRNKARQFRNSE